MYHRFISNGVMKQTRAYTRQLLHSGLRIKNASNKNTL